MIPSDKVQPIATKIRKYGFVYRSERRKDNIAIYEVRSKAGGLLGWEVVIIRVAKAAKLPGGKTAPPREVYPSSEEFGSRAWFYSPSQEEKMLAKFESLISIHS